jgi:NADH-quinone oxidoreductase subunit J
MPALSPSLCAFPLAAASLSPVLILVLCVIAAIGTVLAMPSRTESAIRKIGGVILTVAGLILVASLIRYGAGSPDANRGGMGPYFWIFSAVAVAGAVRVITHARPVYSALYFVLTVMASAGLFILLSAEFMAAALVIIYAGAILVTYVFVIMLASQTAPAGDESASTGQSTRRAPIADYDNVSREPVLASAVGFTLAAVLLYVIYDKAETLVPSSQPVPMPQGMTQALGAYLFQHQVYSLELAGLILTLAMVGAIVISRRHVVSPVPDLGPESAEVAPATPLSDDPHSIPVYGTDNPRAKAYPEA